MDSEFIIVSKRSDANKNMIKIMNAAKKIYAQKGFTTTIEEIAMEADVGVGTVYRRFKNKQQLANAVANEVISEIYEDQEQILKSDLSAVEKVQQIFACYAKITQKYGEIHPMIVELLVSEEGNTEFRDTFLQSLKKLYAEIINTGQKEGVFREGDPRVYEIFLQNMINPFIIKQIAELMPLKETPYFLADLALNGLLKKN